MSTVVIKTFTPLNAGLAARISGIVHILRIGGFYHFQYRFDEAKRAFELTYKGGTYWAGVDERLQFLVTSAPGSEVPKALVEELKILADRSDAASALYNSAQRVTSIFPLGVNLTFKAAHW